MIIQGALANFNSSEVTSTFLQVLNGSGVDIDLYEFTVPEGLSVKSGIDWRTVLHDTAAVVTLAPLLWSAYLKIIDEVPVKKDSGIYIQIKNCHGNSTDLFLGADIKGKEEFLTEFIRSAMALLEEENCVQSPVLEEEQEIQQSEFWSKVEKMNQKA
ncbi:TPA: hypothetical protein NJ126_004528 [Vibrio parahaemolyticus]|nr:hypothetical protein [Vibrio parahaemolyticus]HCG5600822.1 hypothetical protein [Vibrio parahaemolyticus]HCG5616716.1 hypothetical protein [Vibrio parahaemolyticus]